MDTFKSHETIQSNESPGLPSLNDVLHRRSLPPVCLYNYYIVLRDRLDMDTLLDFWLDVAQAAHLYKRYIRHQAKQLPCLNKPHPSDLTLSDGRTSTSSNFPDLLTRMLLIQPRPSIATTVHSAISTQSNKRPTQEEMAEVIERIYLRYIVPNAEKEITQLPSEIRQAITHHFSDDDYLHHKRLGPEDPAIFLQAKQFVYQQLETTFPQFIKYKVFMNLTLFQQVGRLAFGLFLLFIGFSLELSLIFLDVSPWQQRLWGILPIGLGVFSIVTSVIGIDPIWVLCFNISLVRQCHSNLIPSLNLVSDKSSDYDHSWFYSLLYLSPLFL
ncbi:hypothetical protein RMCBS344292_11103 [Rhizopus microsporus]|nr:hypothetical protein RMCBS344292_11103 [Rhizopus microsporus]